MSTEKRFMSITETARFTGLSERYIRRSIKAHSIPVIYSGNKALINIPLFLNQLDRESEAKE